MVVEVGGWEHECCGAAYERGQLVDLNCVSYLGGDGRNCFSEVHHVTVPDRRVRGRITDIAMVLDDGSTRAILRLPSGAALRHFDDDDDGLLRDPWSERLVGEISSEFILTVRT